MKSQRNKPRLLLALYARPKYPESYHYALLITPKITAVQNTKSLRAIKYHVKNTIENIKDRISQPWRFERVVIDDINPEPWLLAGVVIGKVVSQEHVERVFGETPVYQVDDPDKDKALTFDCRSWVVDAVERLQKSDVVSSLLGWETLERRAVEYVEGKKRMGRWNAGQDTSVKLRVPIIDWVTESEITT
ncbi:hypothetical protein BDV30DRAFT_207610 [Aspergillus minisclerotigenes]|uniref:Uncharacterized protein n=1 Tax=Aspergillus minisclerotigenes TaxID=656917 RepID=A0A5N6JBX8_9EURO|nr:hypothetical protein BDV30DRAFT_207610 [Aspergillus minisclerotigenes]